MENTDVRHRMFWALKRNKDVRGEGELVTSPKKAADICSYHNWAFPKFRHWFEEVHKDEAREPWEE